MAGLKNTTWLPCHFEAEETLHHEKYMKSDFYLSQCNGDAHSTPYEDNVLGKLKVVQGHTVKQAEASPSPLAVHESNHFSCLIHELGF